MTKAGWIAATLFMASAIGIQAHAADVKIGVIYPLTGNAASAGQSAKDAVELGAEIVNRGYPELKAMPLGATAGLPNLGGAKIVLVQADHQGNPQVGQQQNSAVDYTGPGRRHAWFVSLLGISRRHGCRRTAGYSISRRRIR